MGPKRFQRKQEDFVCDHCGKPVVGSGYTNHCPSCLWSKHVDVNPGDRAAVCGGLMAPEALSKAGESFVVLHRCLDCGYEKPNKTSREDDISAYLEGVL